MKTDRQEVYQAIDSERDYQDKKWGSFSSMGRPGHGERTVDEFVLYIHGYTSKLVDIAVISNKPEEVLDFVRKVAGLCVHCMEQHGAPKR